MNIDEWQKKANEGSTVAQGILGDAYLWGKEVAPDYEKALKWLGLAASEGVATSLFNLGYMHGKGIGVAKDINKAIEYYKKAAKREDSNALLSLGSIYYNGDGIDQDHNEAEKWFDKAVKIAKVDAGLAFRTAYRFMNGYGLPKIPKYAFLWYKIAKENAEHMLNEISLIIDNSKLKEFEKLFKKLRD